MGRSITDRLASFEHDGVPGPFQDVCRDAQTEIRELRTVLWAFVDYHGGDDDPHIERIASVARTVLDGTYRDNLSYQIRALTEWRDDLERENRQLRAKVSAFGTGRPWWRRLMARWKSHDETSPVTWR